LPPSLTPNSSLVPNWRAARWRIAIGLIVSATCVGLLLLLIDWRRTAVALGSMDVRWIFLATLLLVSCYIAFAIRWWLLVQCHPGLPIARLFAVLMMGLAVNVALPLRPGDALRAYLAGHVYRGGTSRVVASIVIERILDVGMVLLLACLVSPWIPLPVQMRTILVAGSVLAGSAAIIAISLALLRAPLRAVLARITARSGHRWSLVLARQLNEFVNGVTMRGSRAQWGLTLVMSLIGWACFCAAMIANNATILATLFWRTLSVRNPGRMVSSASPLELIQ
jgi:glycosyltransferase 2 family protein